MWFTFKNGSLIMTTYLFWMHHTSCWWRLPRVRLAGYRGWGSCWVTCGQSGRRRARSGRTLPPRPRAALPWSRPPCTGWTPGPTHTSSSHICVSIPDGIILRADKYKGNNCYCESILFRGAEISSFEEDGHIRGYLTSWIALLTK